MSTMTKKLPVSLSFGNYHTDKNEFLIPLSDPRGRATGFVGLKSGAIHEYGAVSFVGKPLSAEEIVAKMLSFGRCVGDVADVQNSIERYLEQMNAFRIGNVVEIHYEEGRFLLRKVADHPPRQQERKLP